MASGATLCSATTLPSCSCRLAAPSVSGSPSTSSSSAVRQAFSAPSCSSSSSSPSVSPPWSASRRPSVESKRSGFSVRASLGYESRCFLKGTLRSCPTDGLDLRSGIDAHQNPTSLLCNRHQRTARFLSVRRRARDEPGEAELQPILKPEEYDFQEFADIDELEEFLGLELESDMLTDETPKHYEVIFLIHERNVDEVPLVLDKVKDFIGDNRGVIHRLNDWGMRRLAYTIKKASRANYILMNIEVGSQAINDLNSLLQKDERVIRHMVMSQKTAITADSVPPEEYPTSRESADDEEDLDEDDDEYENDEDEEEPSELTLQRE